MQGRTTFVIAHRLSTVEKSDVILVIDQGSIIEMGSHRDLLIKNGLYSQLHKMQFKDDALIEV
jgi:subfamily B ATP-binding cassette protein MsbA